MNMIKNISLFLMFTVSLSGVAGEGQESGLRWKESKVGTAGFAGASIYLETERLALRLVDVGDAHDLFLIASDKRVTALTVMFECQHTTVQETEEFIAGYLEAYKQQKRLPWAVIHKQDNKVIGLFTLYCDHKNNNAELGYAFLFDYWGNGFATEAVQAVVDFGFNVVGFERLFATFDPRNKASGCVLEKNNFRYEGLLRHCYFFKNEFCDRVIVARLKSDV